MSVLLTAIDVTDDLVTDRKRAQILERAMYRIAQNHRMVTMGDHFRKNAKTAPGGAYGYVARSSRYTERKLKRYGTDVPNVRTGALKRATRNNSLVTSTQDRSVLTIKAPTSWKAKGSGARSGMNEQRRAELEAMTPEEVRQAQEYGQKYVKAEFEKPENRRKRKRRVT